MIKSEKKYQEPDFANNPVIKRKVDELNAYLKRVDLSKLYDDNPKKSREVAKK